MMSLPEFRTIIHCAQSCLMVHTKEELKCCTPSFPGGTRELMYDELSDYYFIFMLLKQE